MNTLALHFMGQELPELTETEFKHPGVGRSIRCIRGKTAGAFHGYNTFQWTKAVQAFCLLSIRAKLHSLQDSNADVLFAPQLVGGSASFAASLDDALYKQTGWLLEMLGTDTGGQCFARRIIQRSNAGRKRPGPVGLSLTRTFLQETEILISLNARMLTTAEELLAIDKKIRRLEAPSEDAIDDLGLVG